jgi:hypothetical protein
MFNPFKKTGKDNTNADYDPVNAYWTGGINTTNYIPLTTTSPIMSGVSSNGNAYSPQSMMDGYWFNNRVVPMVSAQQDIPQTSANFDEFWKENKEYNQTMIAKEFEKQEKLNSNFAKLSDKEKESAKTLLLEEQKNMLNALSSMANKYTYFPTKVRDEVKEQLPLITQPIDYNAIYNVPYKNTATKSKPIVRPVIKADSSERIKRQIELD